MSIFGREARRGREPLAPNGHELRAVNGSGNGVPAANGHDADEAAIAGRLSAAAASLDQLVKAAERAASAIRDDAPAELEISPELWTRRERLVAELMTSLSERADELSSEAAGLSGLLARASSGLVDAAPEEEPPAVLEAPLPTEAPAPTEPRAPAEQPRQAFEPRQPRQTFAPRVSCRNGDVSDDGAMRASSVAVVRLIANQMAVSGATREEAEERLRREFGVADPSEVVATVYQCAGS